MLLNFFVAWISRSSAFWRDWLDNFLNISDVGLDVTNLSWTYECSSYYSIKSVLISVCQDGDAGVVGALVDQDVDERLGCVDQLDLWHGNKTRREAQELRQSASIPRENYSGEWYRGKCLDFYEIFLCLASFQKLNCYLLLIWRVLKWKLITISNLMANEIF